MVINMFIVIVGIVMLYFGGNWLVAGSANLARSFGVSALIVGLTVVAFGTSTPELLVSVSAALQGTNEIAVGNIVGSNIANIGLILGLSGLVFPVAVHAGLVRREIPILILVTSVSALIVIDGQITRLDAVLLLIGMVGYNALMIYSVKLDRQSSDLPEEEAEYESRFEPPITAHNRPREVMRLLLGLVVLMIGAQLTVVGATNLARAIGISELVIGITLVAVGTSLPELATSVVAAFQKESDIAIGNVVGSNIYNLLAILGLTAFLRPISLVHILDPRSINTILARPWVEDVTTWQQLARYDIPIMVIYALVLLPMVLNLKVSRKEGVLLMVSYAAFAVFVVVR